MRLLKLYYYFEVDDTTGTKKEKTFIGRKQDDCGNDFYMIAQRINNYIEKKLRKKRR